MNRRAFFPLVVILLFLLGLLGQYQLSPLNLTERFSTSVYEILMLFLLDGEWTLELEEVPIAIEIVRFAAPLVAIASLVYVIAANARIALENYFLRYYRGQTVVVGLGEESYQFLKTCDKRAMLVVVERDPNNALIPQARAIGFNVLVRDITQDDTYRKVNLLQAESVIVFTGSDGDNVEIALKLRDILRKHGTESHRSRLHIHLHDVGLAHLLEKFPRFSSDSSGTEIYFFSVYDLSARLLLRDYPAEVFADVAGQERVHLAIHGYGRLAEKIIIEAAHLFQFRNAGRLHISVYDEQAEERSSAFAAAYPHLPDICDVEFFVTPPPAVQSYRMTSEDHSSVTQHLICKDADDENLEIALRLREFLLSQTASNAPIFVRMQRSAGLAQLVHTDKGEPEIPDGIFPFGMLDEVLHVDNVLSRKLDGLARAMHDMYVQESQVNSADPASRPPAWAQLTQNERKQNLFKADHWPVRLRAVRCTSDQVKAPLPELPEQEVTLQAVMEHNRYVAQKAGDGWRYGSEKSNTSRTNPFMLPWDELPLDQRDLETWDARLQPDYFSENMGQYVKRIISIGVTGHRLNKMDVDNKALQTKIKEALEAIQSKHPQQYFSIYSSLAEGSDRLVAKLAMEIIDAKLQVLLPLPYELSLPTFTSEQSIDEFQSLIGQSLCCYELPMKFGTEEELAISPEARNKQYALAGAYLAQRCDYLIAIWDGQPEEGTGGTGQVVRWYRDGGINPEYLYPDIYFEPPMKNPPVILEPYPS